MRSNFTYSATRTLSAENKAVLFRCYLPLVYIFPLPEPGHIYPTIPLARGLQSHGFTVTYIVTSLFAPYLSNCGFSVHLLGSGLTDTQIKPIPLYSMPGSGVEFWQSYVGSPFKPILLYTLAELISQSEPDLVLIDRSLFLTPLRTMSIRELGRTQCIAFSTSLIRWGQSNIPQPFPTIVFCPIELEIPKFRSAHSSFHFVESSIDFERVEAPLLVANDAAGCVLCCFGTQSDRHTDLVRRTEAIAAAALATPGTQFFVTVGHTVAAASLLQRWEFPNLTIAASLPQLRLLRKAAAFVSHGGLGGVKEAILCGVPSIVVPELLDQPMNAVRVEQHQLGLAISASSFSTARLINGLEALMATPAIHQSVQHYERIFRQRELLRPSLEVVTDLFDKGRAGKRKL